MLAQEHFDEARNIVLNSERSNNPPPYEAATAHALTGLLAALYFLKTTHDTMNA
jgi:hypothetical protein